MTNDYFPDFSQKIEVVQQDDGTVTQLATDEPLQGPAEGEVPFNLETLRRHLGEVVLARRILSEDVAARQRLLEQSVYNVAVERLKHQAEMMDQLGLPSKGLKSNDLKTWMWEWHQKLQQRIKAEVDNMVVEERVMGTHLVLRSCRTACVLTPLSLSSDEEDETLKSRR